MPNDEISPERFSAAYLGFLEAMQRNLPPTGPVLIDRIREHLGVEVVSLPVVTETFDAFEHPNLQVAFDDFIAEADPGAVLVGIGSEQKQYVASALSSIMGQGEMSGLRPVAEGPVDYVNFHLAEARVLSCVQHGIYLVHVAGSPVVAAVLGPSQMHGSRMQVHLEVASVDPDAGRAFLVDLRARMRRLDVYRGRVISLEPGAMHMGPQTLVAFRDLPPITRDDVVLPDDLMERIERHTVVFAEHAAVLAEAGRSLKRGMLFHGVPGTGKTLTLMYLTGRMPGRTVLLMTGNGMGMLPTVMQMARSLAPSMVVVEDVDLIAEERGNPYRAGGGLLFDLLDELDGLGSDIDVIFALTSNRPEALETALAARPGRVDLAVEFPLPDVDHRRRLLELYSRGMTLESVDFDAVAAAIEGASPAWIKELLRRAAVLSVAEDGKVAITSAHLAAAQEELASGGLLGQRMLGFQSGGQEPPPHTPGFPAGWIPGN